MKMLIQRQPLILTKKNCFHGKAFHLQVLEWMIAFTHELISIKLISQCCKKIMYFIPKG